MEVCVFEDLKESPLKRMDAVVKGRSGHDDCAGLYVVVGLLCNCVVNDVWSLSVLTVDVGWSLTLEQSCI